MMLVDAHLVASAMNRSIDGRDFCRPLTLNRTDRYPSASSSANTSDGELPAAAIPAGHNSNSTTG